MDSKNRAPMKRYLWPFAFVCTILLMAQYAPNHPSPATLNTVPLGDGTKWVSTAVTSLPGLAVWQAGTTAGRPGSPVLGEMYLDTDLNLPIWWNGTNWISAAGLPQ